PLRSLTSDDGCKASAVPEEGDRKSGVYRKVLAMIPGSSPDPARARCPVGAGPNVEGQRSGFFQTPRSCMSLICRLMTFSRYSACFIGARLVVAQRLDVDDARDIRRARAVVLPADDAPLVVDDVRAPAEGVDGRRLLGEEVVGAHVGRDDVQVVVEGACPALDLEHLVCRLLLEKRKAID